MWLFPVSTRHLLIITFKFQKVKIFTYNSLSTMISEHQINGIDKSYFSILEATPFYLVLQSKNTGHYWHILESTAAGHTSFRIQHKHHREDSYHQQTSAPSIEAACTYIMKHDAFHLERKKLKEARRRNRHPHPVL